MVSSDFRTDVEIWQLQYKLLFIYGGIAEIPASYRKSGLMNTMVTSDFRPLVEI